MITFETDTAKAPLLARPLAAFLRLFFKLLYHEFAWSYDLVATAVSLGLWDEWVLSTLPYLQGPRVLEIGHGPGHLQVALRKKGIFAVGLDESWDMSRHAGSLLNRWRFNLLLVNGYAQFMPFRLELFDQVVATFPSEYIFNSHTISEIYRVLRPGGELIILPTAWITDRRTPYRLAAWLFKITGQAPHWDNQNADPFQLGGFQVQVKVTPLRSSKVLMIHAIKTANQ